MVIAGDGVYGGCSVAWSRWPAICGLVLARLQFGRLLCVVSGVWRFPLVGLRLLWAGEGRLLLAGLRFSEERLRLVYWAWALSLRERTRGRKGLSGFPYVEYINLLAGPHTSWCWDLEACTYNTAITYLKEPFFESTCAHVSLSIMPYASSVLSGYCCPHSSTPI